MASTWSRVGRTLGRMAVRQGPRLAREAPRLLRRFTERRGDDSNRGGPVASRTSASGERARRVSYSPDMDGQADPGEIVWAWVAYEEDASQGKDRPVLVVGRDSATLLGLMLSSKNHGDDPQDWLSLGVGEWDREGRESWVRLDRVLDVPEDGIRREGAVLGRSRFDAVAARLRSDHGWS